MTEIGYLSYWDLDNYTKFVNSNQPRVAGKQHMRELKPEQQRMIDLRKEQTTREKGMKNK